MNATTHPERLTTVHLHGMLGRRFGRVHKVYADTPFRALAIVRANHPEINQILLDHAGGWSVRCGKVDHRDEAGLHVPTSAKTVHVVPLVHGANNGPVKMLAGAALIVIGAVVNIGSQGAGTPLGNALINTGIALMVGGASQWLSRAPGRDQQGTEASPSWVFNGAVNTDIQGSCVPVLYGKLRVGSVAVSAGIAVDDVAGSSNFKVISASSLRAIENVDKTLTLLATGGSQPYVWELNSYSCPASITGNVLTITPMTGHKTERISVMVTGADGRKATQAISVTVVTAGANDGFLSGAGGGDAGGGHVPSESPNSLRSTATARLIDLISEGPCVGLVNGRKSIYLDDVPLENADGSQNFEVRSVEWTYGYPDQTPLNGWSAAEAEQGDGREVKYGSPVTFSVSDTTVDAVRVTVGVPALYRSADNGDMVETDVYWKVEVLPNGGTWKHAEAVEIIGQKCTSRYQRSSRIRLRDFGAGPWQVRVTRTVADSTSVNLVNKTFLDSWTAITEAKLSYPNSCLVGLAIDAKAFQSVPRRSYEFMGRIIRVPSNYDARTRVYTGSWDGSWKLSWTDNPAWIYLDLVTHPRYGLGKRISISQVDTASLYEIAKYCDELIPDGKGGTEPRFTCNTYLQSPGEAYEVLNGLSSVFRGMTFWAGGSVCAGQDRPDTSRMLFNESNVENGIFNYTETSSGTRYNAMMVGWSDPAEAYRTQWEYVVDTDDIAAHGLIQAPDEVALGATSQAQARRWGLWKLYVSRYESEICSWTAGLDAAHILPGNLVMVQDTGRSHAREGGRILSSDGTVHQIDATFTLPANPSSLWVASPDGKTAIKRSIVSLTGTTLTTAAFPAPLEEGSRWIMVDDTVEPATYRVVSRREVTVGTSWEIQAIRHRAGKYASIEQSLTLPTKPTVPTLPSLTAPQYLTTAQAVVSADGLQATRLDVSWAAVPGALGYSLTWARAGAPAQTVEVTSQGWSLDRAAPGTYTITCEALGLAGQHGPRSTTTATVASTNQPAVDKALTPSVVGDGVTRDYLWVGPELRIADWQESMPLTTVSRTNLTTNSTISSLGYNPAAHQLVAGALIAPDGTACAAIQATQTNPSNAAFNTADWLLTKNFALGEQTTASVYFYPGTLPDGDYQIGVGANGGGGGRTATFSILSGRVSAKSSDTLSSVQAIAGGWYRLIIPFTWSVAKTNFVPVFYPTAAALVVGSRWGLWGLQVESGVVATRYIKPSGTAKTVTDYTRSGDVVTLGDPLPTGVTMRGASGLANREVGYVQSDAWLSKGEKPGEVQRWNTLTSEQAGILAQASAYGTSTEASTYSTAITSLGNYLTSLSPTWTDSTTNTPIVAATYNQKWQDAYASRQALLNAISAKAKVIADAAQAQADYARRAASTTNLIPNGNSEEASPTGVAAASVVTDAGAFTGAKMRLSTGSVYVTDEIPCIPGERYLLQCQGRAYGGGRATIGVRWTGSSGVIGYVESEQTTPVGGWSPLGLTATAPAGATSVAVYLNHAGTGTEWAWDCLYAERIQTATANATDRLDGMAADGVITPEERGALRAEYDQLYAAWSAAYTDAQAAGVSYSAAATAWNNYSAIVQPITLATGNSSIDATAYRAARAQTTRANAELAAACAQAKATAAVVAAIIKTSNFAQDSATGAPTAGAALRNGGANPILVGPGGMVIGVQTATGWKAVAVDSAVVLSLGALRGTATNVASPKVWFAGNNQQGGVPATSCMQIIPINTVSYNSCQTSEWGIRITPTGAATDNLDGLMRVEMEFYALNQTTPFAVRDWVISSRGYCNLTTPGDALNQIRTTVSMTSRSAPAEGASYSSAAYIRARLVGVEGAGPWLWYSPATNGTVITGSASTPWASAPATGGSTSGGSSGNGSIGGNLPGTPGIQPT